MTTQNIELKTTQDLLDTGHSHRSIAAHVRQQRLISLRKGIYIDAATWNNLYPSDKHLAKTRALALQNRYVFTHETAAIVFGLPILTVPQKVHAYTMGSCNSDISGVQKHRYDEKPPSTTYKGLEITTPIRTVIDCARTLKLPDALCIADGALHRGFANSGELREALETVNGRGSRQCRRIATQMSAQAESPGETLARLELIKAGIGFTEQVWVNVDGMHYRADFTIEDLPLILEFDGDIKFRDNASQTVLNERKRERALQNVGWSVVRVEWRDLKVPGQVAEIVRGAMRRLRQQ